MLWKTRVMNLTTFLYTMKTVIKISAFCVLFIASLNLAQAQSNGAFYNQTLDSITVYGKSGQAPGGLLNDQSRNGILGDVSVMDIPYSQMSLSKKTLEVFSDPSQPIANILQANPSIRTSTSSPMYTDFSMRGINMNGNHMMLNGIPSLFYQFTTPPSHIIERIDITSGPNAGVNGTSMSNNGTDSGATPAPGTINVITKKAENDPVNSYKVAFSGRGNMAAYVDVARRFGNKKEWGIRVNSEYMDGKLSLPGASKSEKNVFLNLDYKGKNSVTNLFVGMFDLCVDGGQRWFTFNGTGTELPSAPKAKMNYDYRETTKYVKGNLFTLNHEQKFNKVLTGFFNFGQNHRSGYKYNAGANLLFDDEGNFSSNNKSNAQSEASNNVYSQLGLRGNVQTGKLKHTFSFGVDYSFATYDNKSINGVANKIGGNLYDGIEYLDGFYPLPQMPTAERAWEENNVGVTALYVLSYDNKLDLLLGASQKNERFKNKGNGQKIKNHNILPTFGITYKPVSFLSIYASHTESFSRGAFVSDAKYVNVGETLDPAKSKQNEVGVKWESKKTLTTLSYFDIKQSNFLDVTVPDGLKRAADGVNRHKGFELTSTGEIIDRLIFTAGLMYLDAEREKTKDGTDDGKFVNGVSKISGTLGLEYKTSSRIGFVGRTVCNGNAYIDSKSVDNKTKIPAFATFDLGVNYLLKASFADVKLNAMCYNVANTSYWHGRGGSTTFGLSMPRSFMLSAQFDF